MITTKKNSNRMSIKRGITPSRVPTHISVKMLHDAEMKGYLVT